MSSFFSSFGVPQDYRPPTSLPPYNEHHEHHEHTEHHEYYEHSHQVIKGTQFSYSSIRVEATNITTITRMTDQATQQHLWYYFKSPFFLYLHSDLWSSLYNTQNRALYVQSKLTKLAPVLIRTLASGSRGQFFCTGFKLNLKTHKKDLANFHIFAGQT